MDSETQEPLKNNVFVDITTALICDIEEFKLCENDEERVEQILDSIDPFHAITDLQEVLKYYSKSILHAPPGSEQLSLAYANRSAVLLEGNYYEECLEDISRALKTGYPNNLKPKLLIRRATCNYALTGNVDFETDEGLIEARALIEKLPTTHKMRKMVEDTLKNPEKITSAGRQVRSTHPKYQPEMKGRNSHLPGASNAIALRYSEEFGRHLVATRDISSGEVLLIEKPYVTIVPHKWIYCICNHCAKVTWNGIPCNNCIHVMFCSAECKKVAWEQYHEVECKVLEVAKDMDARDHMLMGLRMTVKAIKEAGSVGALKKRLKELDSVKASDVEISMDPNSYEMFYIMSDNPESQKQNRLAFCSLFAGTLTYHLAMKTNLFEGGLVGNPLVVEDSERLFLFTAGLMLRNTRIAMNRAIGQGEVENPENMREHQILMLLPVSSYLNSRCYDATELLRFDENIMLVTPVPIGEGDQIFRCYGRDYQQTPANERRKYLKDQWQFVCNCSACTEDWSHSTPTIWHDEPLPDMEIMLEMLDVIKQVKLSSLEETKDPMKMIPIKEHLCKLIDFMYPRVRKPCISAEQYVNAINQILMKLSSRVHPRFIDEL